MQRAGKIFRRITITRDIMKVARLAILCLALPIAAGAQGSKAPDTTAKKTVEATPALDFSGVLFANYQYRGDNGGRSANKFDLDRVYLTFRIPAGKHLGVRVTTDIFQQTASGSDSYYKGWTIRAKYAYLQYNYLNGTEWQSSARAGLIQTVFIDHDEQFWPRWISTSPTDRAGYFSSADAGLANTVSLPKKFGQLYAAITNGPGYTSRETDRFKDYAARLTITPWARDKSSPLNGLALSAWGYKGAVASRFVDGGIGQQGAVGSGLDRDRWGLHAANLHPRLTIGAEYAWRRDEGEAGNNTAASPRVVIDSTGALLSLYGVARPFSSSTAEPHPLSLVARYDRVSVNKDRDSKYEVIIAGAIWDLSNKVSVAVDYQENNPVTANSIARAHTWFAHVVARF
jgi:hypothetical protein